MPDSGIPLLTASLEEFNIDPETLLYFSQTWRKSTTKLYTGHILRWVKWAEPRNISILKPNIAQVLRFLRFYFESGVGYAALNAARCALSLILPRVGDLTIGKHFLIKWFLKSCYEKRPPQPRYSNFWSVNKVLQWIKSIGSNANLSLKMLTYKLTILLLLVSSQRGQTILSLDISRLEKRKDAYVFRMASLLKHNYLGQPLDSLTFYPYVNDTNLCVVETLQSYLKRTQTNRNNEKQLLLSFISPFKPISRSTLARWTINVLKLSGIDISKYSAHSTRGASASHALKLGLNLNAIMRNAGWRDSSTFAKFYHKQIETTNMVQASMLTQNA